MDKDVQDIINMVEWLDKRYLDLEARRPDVSHGGRSDAAKEILSALRSGLYKNFKKVEDND